MKWNLFYQALQDLKKNKIQLWWLSTVQKQVQFIIYNNVL